VPSTWKILYSSSISCGTGRQHGQAEQETREGERMLRREEWGVRGPLTSQPKGR
jgi:hypothetical protein